jgi:Ca2+-binding EF-hand superfamily protein
MLQYIRQYYEYWVAMARIDTNGDHIVTLKEFEMGVPIMNRWGIFIDQPVEVFKTIDINRNGLINFYEFCKWAIRVKLDIEDDDN